MEIMEKTECRQEVLPGRAIRNFVGAEYPLKSEKMTVKICTYKAEYGPMEPHNHAEETVVVLASDRGSVSWGPTKACDAGKAPLKAGDVLHIPDMEWHVFTFEEGGSLEALCIFAP